MPGRERSASMIPTKSPQPAPPEPGCGRRAAGSRGPDWGRSGGRLRPGGKVVSGVTRVGPGGRTVIETPEGITVYAARCEGDLWRAVWYEDGERRQCQAATEDRVAASLEKVAVRLTADAPSMLRTGDDLVAFYLSPDLCVPKTSSKSCDQAIFVDQATDASVSSDAILLKIDRFGQRFQRRGAPRAVRPVLVMVGLVVAQDPPQMVLVHDQGAVQEFAAASPDSAFGDRVHAGRPDVAEFGPDPGVGEDRIERGSEVGAAVADHELDPVCLSAEVLPTPAGSPGPKCGWIPIIPSGRSPPPRLWAILRGPSVGIPALGNASTSQANASLASGVAGSHRAIARSISAGTTSPPGRRAAASRRNTSGGSGTCIKTSRWTIASNGLPGAWSWMSPPLCLQDQEQVSSRSVRASCMPDRAVRGG